jgi:HK97 family phage prohead protease
VKFKQMNVRRFKALDDAQGTFEAIVAVFGNVDLAGDRIVKGAFADSLKAWEQKGRPIPVVFSHDWQNLDAHIGEVLEAKETDEGLWVKAQLDMEDPKAAKVFRLMKSGRLVEFSFAYDVLEEKLQNGANELLKLDVIEVGPTLKGMNPATQLLGVKSTGPEHAARIPAARKQAVAGSFEERRELISAALWAKYGDNDRYWLWVMATFDDSAIYRVEDEEGAVSYRQIDYTLEDGTLTLGDERDVALQTVIVPKSLKPKGSTPPVAKSEDRASGKGEEPRPGSLATRVAAELLELGIDV